MDWVLLAQDRSVDVILEGIRKEALLF